MAAKLKFMRMGAKKRPFYRLVVANELGPRTGKFIEVLGYYQPHKTKALIHINTEKITRWLGQGATPTDAVEKFLVKQGVITRSAAKTKALEKQYAAVAAKREAEKQKASAQEAPAEAKEEKKDKPAPEETKTEAVA